MVKDISVLSVKCSCGRAGRCCCCCCCLALLGLGDNLGVGDGVSALLLRDELALLRHLLHPLALRVLRQAVVGHLVVIIS